MVVSASTLETPRLLLNSGIQGPAIGRYLTGHVSIIAIGTISRRQFSDKLGNLAVLKFETNESPYQIQILGPDQYFSYQQFEDKELKDQLMVVYASFGRVESRAENRVYLTAEKDEFGVPLQQVQYSLSNKDHQIANQVAQGIKQSATAMGVTLDESTLELRPPGQICMRLVRAEWEMIQRHQRLTVMVKCTEFKVYLWLIIAFFLH